MRRPDAAILTAAGLGPEELAALSLAPRRPRRKDLTVNDPADDLRAEFLAHLRALAAHWATTDLTRPEFREAVARAGGETRYRLDGLVFSVLVAIDGGAGGYSGGLDLVARFAVEDDDPRDGLVINEDAALHEEWSAGGR
jgi:hypothetical protein